VRDEHLVVNVSIGDVYASAQGVEIRTVLGSCVAACLYDPVTGVGGMNHFLLPYGDAAQDPGRYGEHAMDLLIGALQRLGAPRGRLPTSSPGPRATTASRRATCGSSSSSSTTKGSP
jgi:chemotaxis receptor (MCP) glutamine deamidase CheD